MDRGQPSATVLLMCDGDWKATVFQQDAPVGNHIAATIPGVLSLVEDDLLRRFESVLASERMRGPDA